MNWSSPFMIFGFLVISAVIFLLVNTLGQSVKHTDINPITMIVTQIIISVFLAFIIYFIEVQKTKNKRKNARKKIFIRLFMLIAVLDAGITKQKELIEMYGSLKKGTYLLENYFNTYMNELQDMFSFYSDVLEYEEIKSLQSHIHIILFMRKITTDADIIKTYEHIKQHLMSDYDYWKKYKPKNFDNHTMDEIITSR